MPVALGTLLTVLVAAAPAWALRPTRATGPASPGAAVAVADTRGQQFSMRVSAGFQPAAHGTAALAVAITNPTAAIEGINIKDQQLAVFGLVPAAAQGTVEDELDRVGDYHALACAGQPVGDHDQNPIPAGFCGLSLDVGPGPGVPTDGSGQTALVAAGATVTYLASTDPSVPAAAITTILIGFPPYAQAALMGVKASTLPTASLPASNLPSGSWRCRARPIRVTGGRVALRPGDRVTSATLSTGGPARQLTVSVTFDGPVTTGSNQPLYELDVALRQGRTRPYALGAAFRRGQQPTGAVLTRGTSSLDVDTVASGDTVRIRTPLLGLPRLRARFRWSVVETVREGPHQAAAFTVVCGPVST